MFGTPKRCLTLIQCFNGHFKCPSHYRRITNSSEHIQSSKKNVYHFCRKCISFLPKMYIIFAKNVAKKYVKGNTL